MGIRIGNIGIDTNDLGRSVAFWQNVTGYKVSSSGDDSTYLEDPESNGVGLSLLVVPEGKQGKNRLHLDLFTPDLPGEIARLKGLGATEVKAHDGWTVLADPDGNQFCVCEG
ncbi:VOC family protein [Longispora albida]|uniref:VOC family protein n=1 Tax=Longispora albida TaxID=203523 RepID=UPI0003786973|nr:VOC family protein [Longispora albida]